MAVYARYGYRGATTRRIALEAGVNEVTIFRQFGSKDALIHEAIATCGGGPLPDRLPDVPVNPSRELRVWAGEMRARIHAIRDMLHRCLSEQSEHPHLIGCANAGPIHAKQELQRYLTALHTHGFVSRPFDVRAASAMLMGAVFSDAMGRDAMPEMYPDTPDAAAEQYALLLLRALGAHETARSVA